jgi:hypothetical protein
MTAKFFVDTNVLVYAVSDSVAEQEVIHACCSIETFVHISGKLWLDLREREAKGAASTSR